MGCEITTFFCIFANDMQKSFNKACKKVVALIVLTVVMTGCAVRAVKESSVLSAKALPTVKLSSLQPGDILFVVNHRRNAITSVTTGIYDLPIDHVAIVVNDACLGVCVVEAIPGQGVVRRVLAQFLADNTDGGHKLREQMPVVKTNESRDILAARLLVAFDADSLDVKLRGFEGLPYDSLYLPDNAAIYCSELVQKSFVDRQGRLILPTIPMEFRDRNGNIPDVFINFYRRNDKEVPEGEPGTNPGQLSRCHEVHIRGFLGK